MSTICRAQVFRPGEFLQEELEARGWSQVALAEILGRPVQVVNAIVKGRKAITAQTAAELSLALGTSAEYWLNLETAWQLAQVLPPDPEIAARAHKLIDAETE
jgi:HTH-type transcriptional regulator / antitoxin HigA